MHPIEESDALELISNLGSASQKFSGKTVLLLGSNGFLGTALSNYFVKLNQGPLKGSPVKVILCDNFALGGGPKIQDDKNFQNITHDICQPFDSKTFPSGPINFILNMASIGSPSFYQKMPLLTLDVGYTGTKNVLDLAKERKVESVILMSSSEVYATPDESNIPTKETYHGNPPTTGERACYDQSKQVLETLSYLYHKLYAVPVKVLRPFNCFGVGLNPNDGRIIPSFISKALNNQPLKIYGEGLETRTFSYVSDLITGVLKVLLSEHNGEIFNIGSDMEGEVSMVELAKMVSEVVKNPKLVIEHTTPPAAYRSQPQRRLPDLSKIKTMVGYSPKVSLEEGLERYYNWVKDIQH